MGCGNESTNRSYTPTKQILLCTAKSLEKRNTLATRIAKKKNLKMNVSLPDRIGEDTEILNDQQLKTDLQRMNHEIKITEAKTELEDNGEKMKNSRIDEKAVNSEVYTEPQRDSVDRKSADEKPPDSSDEDSGQSDKEPEKRIAPLQLMGEFLKAIMEQKYNLAKKLCQMILIYEPKNPEAKQFLPLIEKKLLLESQHADKEDEEIGEGSSDESEEETSSSEDSGTESGKSSEDSDKNL